jgi:hypothetical protein
MSHSNPPEDLERGRPSVKNKEPQKRSYSVVSAMSGISLASIMNRFTILPHRQEQRRKVLDYLFENLDQGDNRCIDKDRMYGLTPKEVTAELISLTEKLYEAKDYSFNLFEKLALVNVLHWQHRLIQLDEKLNSGEGLLMERALPKKDAVNSHSPSHIADEDEISHGEAPKHQRKRPQRRPRGLSRRVGRRVSRN